jgi:hypothetical protein
VPEPLEGALPIDPRVHSIETHVWDQEAVFYLVHVDGKHYAWITRLTDNVDQVYEMLGEDEARAFLAEQRARLLLGTDWGRRVAAVVAASPGGAGVVYEAVVVDGWDDGIWLVTRDATGETTGYVLARFGDLHNAVEAFASHAEEAAGRIEANQRTGYPEILAAHLRYRAAMAMASSAQVALGEVMRRNSARIRAGRAVSPIAHAIGVSREFVHRVLTDDEWVWKGTAALGGRSLEDQGREKRVPVISPHAHWDVTLSLGIDAPGEDVAIAVARDVQADMDVAFAGELAATRSGGREWIVEAQIDLSGLDGVSPDNAVSRIKYVSRNVGGVTWRIDRDDEHHGVYQWQRESHPAAGESQVFLHPAVRAAAIVAHTSSV